MVIVPLLLASLFLGDGDAALTESDVYRVVDVPIPDGVVLEVGGLLPVGDDDLLVCTRRGDVWRVHDVTSDAPTWTLFADGLHEPLGLLLHEGRILCCQRAEVTELRDDDGDGFAEVQRVVNDGWDVSGSYHEYAFGPRVGPDGALWVTLNRPFDAEPFGRVPFRGWAVRLRDDGRIDGMCAGLRSPCGVETAPWGDLFYTDNQGEWCGASKLSILSEGDFHGHPLGINSCHMPASRVEHPGEIPDGLLMGVAAKRIPHFRLPAVWFPYDEMGRSPSGFCWDGTGGAFGPFEGQVFVGDQYQASVLRVSLEQVDGVWQGACHPFRKGLASGVIRTRFLRDGSLAVGMSDRGWPSLGDREYGLQRLVWTGVVPFEIAEMKARPDGFRLVLTKPVSVLTALPSSFDVTRYTYELHSDYGSDEIDTQQLFVRGVDVSDDGRTLDLVVEGMKAGYVHELTVDGLHDVDGGTLLHDKAYYTLTEFPGDDPPSQIVFVAADDEYRSEESLPMLAAILERDFGVEATVCVPTDADGALDLTVTDHVAGLDALRDADLLVMFTRFRDLPDDELQRIEQYVGSGRPVVGFRTATHAFRYPQGDLRAERTAHFGRDTFGADWIAHHGHGSHTEVALAPEMAADGVHPILRGVTPFSAASWLYHVKGGGDDLDGTCTPLLLGRAVDSEQPDATRFPRTQPVAWTRDDKVGRTAFTTLGHPDDFREPSMRRLALQMILWALDREAEIPADGVDATPVGGFDPSPAGLVGG